MKMLRTLIVICAKMLFIHISFKERQLLLMYKISQGGKIQFTIDCFINQFTFSKGKSIFIYEKNKKDLFDFLFR